MTGIVAGAAALIGVASGWWGAAIIALLVVILPVVGPNRPCWAICAVAIAAVILGAWRAESDPSPAQIARTSQSAPSGVVVTAPDFTGQRQSFVVTLPDELGVAAQGLSARVCVMAGPVPVVRLGDTVQASGKLENLADLPMGLRVAISARGCDLACMQHRYESSTLRRACYAGLPIYAPSLAPRYARRRRVMPACYCRAWLQGTMTGSPPNAETRSSGRERRI